MKLNSIVRSTLFAVGLSASLSSLSSVWAASPFGSFASKQTLEYAGNWENTTFASADTYTVRLELDGRDFSITTSIEGSVYGIGISVPLTFSGTLEGDDQTDLNANFATYGDVTATIDSSSSPILITATSTPDVATGITPSTSNASFDFESLAATFTVNFSGGGSAAGNSAMFLVEQPPAIHSISPSLLVASGESADLSVETSGSLVSVQWYAGASGDLSMPILGATDQSFNTGALTESQDYWVRVENSSGASINSSTVSVTVGSVWYATASQIQPAGWRYFDWFKGFKPEGPHWIYHGRHGWLYVLADNTSSMFLWDVALGRWMFTNATIYPWLYAYGPDGGWVFFFEGGSPGSRFFQRGDNGQVLAEQALRVF